MNIRLLSVLCLVVIASGCGIKAQTYVMSKPRVGIEKGNGNAGYLSGTPVYVEPTKKTRKIYVLELTKAVPEGEVKKIEKEITEASSTKIDTTVHVPDQPPVQAPAPAPKRIVIPKIEDEPITTQNFAATEAKSSTGLKEAITYTVQKDDTLQKIAKKYLGSYGEWLKIYNANKDKIKNPNLLRPGTVITIPAGN